MDSISIPIEILQELQLKSQLKSKDDDNGNGNGNNNDNNDILMDGSDGKDETYNNSNDDVSLEQPVILYFKPPPSISTSISSSSSSSEDNLLFLILNNVIPIISRNTSSSSISISNSSSNSSRNIVELNHPFLEEFMILSARAIDNSLSLLSISTSISISTPISISISISTSTSVPVWIQHIHPPDYCYNENVTNINDSESKSKSNSSSINSINTTTNNNSYSFHNKISKQRFYLQRPKYIHDLSSSSTTLPSSSSSSSIETSTASSIETFVINLKLEFIYCSNERYEQWFLLSSSPSSTTTTSSSSSSSERKDQNQNQDNMNNHTTTNDDQIKQYIYETICQALEYKVMKRFMVLPIELPPFPHYNHNTIDNTDYSNGGGGGSDNDNDNNEEDESIVAFFKLTNVHIQTTTTTTTNNDDSYDDEHDNEHDDEHINKMLDINENSFFRTGLIAYHNEKQNLRNKSNDMNRNMNMNMNNKNIVSIQVVLPPVDTNINTCAADTTTTTATVVVVGEREKYDNDDHPIHNTYESKTTHGTIINDGMKIGGQEQEQKQKTQTQLLDSSCSCPGYDELLKEIIAMSNITVESGSPTGILLTGCTGVGKSKMASSVSQILSNDSTMIRMISAKDILLQASSSIIDINSLKKMILPTNSNAVRQKQQQQQQQHQQRRRILIIDDIDIVLESNNENESTTFLFDERRATLHSILESIDEIIKERHSLYKNDHPVVGHDSHCSLPFILGICCSDSLEVPSILNRIGRFEKIITMPPPSEIQRRMILRSMLHQLPIVGNGNGIKDIDGCPISKEELIDTWCVALARTTAGCVASDLRRICVDALTKSKSRSSKKDLANYNHDSLHQMKEGYEGVSWKDMREATRSCIPSQLANLDVTIPRDENDDFDISLLVDKKDTKERFNHCWQNFGGYEEMKANLYRSVFRPWCRRHNDDEVEYPMSKLEREVPPPTGILFHGASGTGKTFAADCLARSLGLNVVKVRASDILDQWLGGSEAAIRSIFSRSRAAAPCLLLFDELDALATNREGEEGGSSDLYSRLLSTLLNEMDGVNNDGGNSDVLVVGTTNRIHAIDAALLRPGRFEKHVLLENPRISDVEDIMKLHLQKAPLSSDVNLMEISELLHELDANGADIRGLCSETCLIAMKHTDFTTTNVDEMFVSMNDFDEAIRLWKK